MIVEPIDPDATELQAALQAAGLPVDDVTDAGRRFFRFSENGQSLGVGGYELYGADALLRSIVILPAARGNGHGRAATRHLLDHARQAGAHTAYLLTTNAAPFFQGLGFQPIDRREAPASILATRQAVALCPSTAALMTLPISRETT